MHAAATQPPPSSSLVATPAHCPFVSCRLHKSIAKQLKYALVWGSSVKHRPQKVRCGALEQRCGRLSRRTMLTSQRQCYVRCVCAPRYQLWTLLAHSLALGIALADLLRLSLPCLPPMQVGKDHVLHDEDIVQLVKKI